MFFARKTHPRQRSGRFRYIDEQAGWRFLFVAMSVSCVLGGGFRLYFSGHRIQEWMDEALLRADPAFALRFDGAELVLADGAMPRLAVVMRNVRFAPAPECQAKASLTVSELRVPLRLSLASLSSPKVRVGSVEAHDAILDLDRFKEHCPSGRKDSAAAKAGLPQSRGGWRTEPAWWRPEQLARVRSVLGGLKFSNSELRFERATKSVFLKTFSVDVSNDQLDDRLEFKAELHIPPNLTHHERLPPLLVSGHASANRAEAIVSLAMSEGRIESRADLWPEPDGYLGIDAEARASDVPLSTIAPLFRKLGIVSEDIKPKFVWLNCLVRIEGRFQGLFRHSPLRLSECALDGDAGVIRLDQAVRRPDGVWDPVRLDLEKIDLRKALRMFGHRGPDGVASEFGRLTGRLDVVAPHTARFDGVVAGARLRFSRRNVEAFQTIESLRARVGIDQHSVAGRIDEIRLGGGTFAGHSLFRFDRATASGEISLDVDSLRFDAAVQKVLTGGRLGSLHGQGKARMSRGEVTGVSAELKAREFVSADLAMNEISFSIGSGRSDPRSFRIGIRAPEMTLAWSSPLVQSSREVFLGHRFKTSSGKLQPDQPEIQWIPLHDVQIEARLLRQGGMVWDQARAFLEDGLIRVTSKGEISRDRAASGWLMVDFPRMKRLKWTFAGGNGQLRFSADETTRAALEKRVRVDSKSLGLPVHAAASGEDLDGEVLSDRATRHLRELSRKVYEKAKGVVPAQLKEPSTSQE